MGRSHQWPLKQKSWITKNRSDKGWAVRTKPYIIVEEISPERGVRGSEKKKSLSAPGRISGFTFQSIMKI